MADKYALLDSSGRIATYHRMEVPSQSPNALSLKLRLQNINLENYDAAGDIPFDVKHALLDSYVPAA